MSIIETEKLTLRPFREGDAEMMYRNWTSDERVARYCRWYAHENIDVTEGLLQMYLDEAADGFKYRWAITLKNTDEPVGGIDVVDISEDGKTVEIGYVIAHKLWNKGLVTEAFEAVINKLFDCGIEKVTARHCVDNPASGRVMEKCGLTFTGYDKVQEKFGSDKLCDVKCYAIEKRYGK